MIDVTLLKFKSIVPLQAKQIKVIASGDITRAITLKGCRVTSGARAAIEAQGGKVEEA